MDEVAVVILNYNGAKYLKQFLPSVCKHSAPHSIYVADNCSTDNSLEVLKSFSEVNVLVLEENYGYAGGYNEALKQIESKYYILLNSDVEVTKNWIEPQLRFLNNHSDYAACQPKILDYQNRSTFEYAGAAGGYLDVLGYPYCRGRIFDHLEKDEGQYDNSVDIFWASGACMMIRSSVFHSLGGFDSGFFAHMEEIDLSWRMKSHGYKISYISESKVYHVGGGTLNKTNSRKTYLNFRNGISLLLKNLPKSSLLIILPIRLVMDWSASLVFWKNLSFSHFVAVWRAHFDAFKLIRTHLKQSKRCYPTYDKHKLVVLPFQYFLIGNKRFSDLNSTK